MKIHIAPVVTTETHVAFVAKRAFHETPNEPGCDKIGFVNYDGFAMNRKNAEWFFDDIGSGHPTVLFARYDEYRVPPALLQARISDRFQAEKVRREKAGEPPMTESEFKDMRAAVKVALAQSVQPRVSQIAVVLVPAELFLELEVYPTEDLQAYIDHPDITASGLKPYFAVLVGASDASADTVFRMLASVMPVPQVTQPIQRFQNPQISLAELVLGALEPDPDVHYGKILSCTFDLTSGLTTTESLEVLRDLVSARTLSFNAFAKLSWRYSLIDLDLKRTKDGDVVVSGVSAPDGVPESLLGRYLQDGATREDESSGAEETVPKAVQTALRAAEVAILAVKELHEFVRQEREPIEARLQRLNREGRYQGWTGVR